MNAISILELKAAGHENLSRFPERIRQHYYDRLYLTVEHWYPPAFIAEIDKHYQVQNVVKQPRAATTLKSGATPS